MVINLDKTVISLDKMEDEEDDKKGFDTGNKPILDPNESP